MTFDFEAASALAAARYLVSEGFSVLPIKPGAKAPPVAWAEYQQRYPTDAELRSWFARNPSWWPGIATGPLSGVVALDVDDLAAVPLLRNHFPCPLIQVITGSGRGRHYYFRHPAGPPITNARSPWALPPRSELAVDIRGAGGLVLAPGAVHRSGGRYRLTPRSAPLSRASIDASPPWPTEALAAPPPPPAPPRPEVGNLDAYERAARWLGKRDPAIAGQAGDTHTFATCASLVKGFGLSDAEALELLRPWNRRCLPPWNERELAAKIQGARRYGRQQVGALL